jgi:(p)ppGpp synthase/HD superfamily hydrolase
MSLEDVNDPTLSFLDHLPLTREAVRFAQGHHGGQQRKADGAPVVLHLLEAASLLERSGCPDVIVAAAVLHDVLEDTDASREQIDAQFGSEVGELVALVSDDPSIADEEAQKDDVRERVRSAGEEAAIVYAADKISKARELRLLMVRDPDNPEIATKLQRYRKSLAMLEERLPGNRLVDVLRFEIEALEQLPPSER